MQLSALYCVPCSEPSALFVQLATLYHEVKVGLEQSTYIPEAMYSCGEHVVGPLLNRPEQAFVGGWA